MAVDNAVLLSKLVEQVDRLSGQVAALLAVVVTQPATNPPTINDAKLFVPAFSADKLNPAPGGLSPLEHAKATVDRIAAQAATAVLRDPGD